jgi:excisionase family DNA binding protein
VRRPALSEGVRIRSLELARVVQICSPEYARIGSSQAFFVATSSKLSIFDHEKFSCLRSPGREPFEFSYLPSNARYWHVPCCFHRLLGAENMKKTDSAIKLLTLAEAASILKISKRTLHRMIQNRQIPAFKVGGQWRILESRFQEWVQEEENTAPKAS